PEMIRDYLDASDPQKGQPAQARTFEEAIGELLKALGEPTQAYLPQLPLFPAIYRLELEFPTQPSLPHIVWDSGIPRPQHANQIRRLADRILGPHDDRAVLHFEYQLHAYNKRQHDEQVAAVRLRWVAVLAVAATGLAFLWILLVQR